MTDSGLHLAVHPDYNSSRGWQVSLRSTRTGEPMHESGRYTNQDDAQAAAAFASDVVDGYWPCRFVDVGSATSGPVWVSGSSAAQVQVATTPALNGWELAATHFAGDVVARSRVYPTHHQASLALGFLAEVAATVQHPHARGPLQVRVQPDCGCHAIGERCLHHVSPARSALSAERPRFNSVSLSIRPSPRSRSDWEVVVRGYSGRPIELSSGYASEEAAGAARGFAIKTINSGRPVRLESWYPEPVYHRGLSYTPPSLEESVTVRVLHSEWAGKQIWRLQARHPDGSVLATSFPYPDREQIDHARDFLGVLSVLAGNPAIEGQLRDTTSEADRDCACYLLADCGHFPDQDTRDPDPPDRGFRSPIL